MRQRILSIALALCLCVFTVPMARAESTVPTPAQVYETLIALKENDRFKEGTPWTDETNSYDWNGGPIAGNVTGGTGCAAFAFELSDIAFGSLPARLVAPIQLSNVLPGDILRTEGNSHSVIVLRVGESGVVVAEGNFSINGSSGIVHWGRTLTKAEVEASAYHVTRYPIGYVPPTDPGADDLVDGGSGALGGGLSWRLTKGGALTISGSGPMPDCSSAADQPWSDFADRILTIVIEDGVTAIGDNAFGGIAIMSVTVPASVKSIGDGAFRECKNLNSVTVSEGVTAIGGNAFRGCTALKSITLPAGIEQIGAGAFMDCNELKSVAFASGSKPVSLGDNLFTQCYNLTSVKLPQNIDRVGEGMFQNCLKLSTLTIPQGAASIGGQAFASCDSLASVWIPDSVTRIETAAFRACRSLTDIYFGGDEAAWNSIQKLADVPQSLEGVTIHYNSTITEPEPGPGHKHSWVAAWSNNSGYHWHECSAENCDVNSDSGKDGYGTHDYDGDTDTSCNICGYTRTPGKPGHEHKWAAAWSNDSTHHWHECSAENCDISSNSGKDGYEAHSYGGWVIDVDATASQSGSRHRTCTVCGYGQRESIPAVGGSSSTGNGSSSSSSPSTTTTTTRNPDGSTTTTETDRRTGTVTETTRNPDGSQTVVETQKDGTVTTRETDRAGNKTETVARPDGSRTVIVEQKDGSAAAVITDAAGKVEAEVRLSASAVSAAQQNGEPAALPIPELQTARNAGTAPTVTVNTGCEYPVKVKIPVADPTPGTVAVIVRADGTEEVIKSSVLMEDAVAVSLPDGAVVKIVDNSRNFVDVSSQNWAADAISYVSARELFAGTTEDTFTPEAPMTRAMLVTALARFDGADTTGGTTWYEKSMDWAVANSISDGSDPAGNITREQLVTMLWRYAGSPAAAGDLSGFTDTDRLSGFAQEAMRWAVENGVINGLGAGQLAPQEQATRAQVAQILQNYLEM